MRERRKQKFMEAAVRDGCVTEGIALSNSQRDSLLSILLDGAPWLKSKTVNMLYEYRVHGKRYLKNLRFRLWKNAETGEFVITYPYKIRVYYSAKCPKRICWENYFRSKA